MGQKAKQEVEASIGHRESADQQGVAP
ncbi:uncharacterized, partial [Tachysurus ichikawai]